MRAGLLQPENVCLQVIDVQESLMAGVTAAERVTTRIVRMVRCATHLGIPIIANTQYRKGLGPTVPAVAAVLAGVPQYDKLTFNALADQDTAAHFARLPPAVHTVALVGIETHICVYQTAMAHLSLGRQVWLVADALSSRHHQDHLAGLARLQAVGASVGPLEMLVFELLGQAGTPSFKAIQPLLVERDSEADCS